MTPEQIDLEFTHIAIDQKLKDIADGKTKYEDEEYENYDKETDNMDSKLSDMDESIKATNKVDDWEDVDENEY